jgi:hypothetical protein
MDTFLFAQLSPFTIYGAGASIGDATLTLSSMKSIDGVNLAMTDFGTIGFGTIEPGNSSQEEQICFTGITQNANGTATLTGVKNVLFLAPYTQTVNLAKSHIGGAQFIISNTSGFYDKMTGKSNDETVTGLWTFDTLPQSSVIPTDSKDLTPKSYVDGVAIAGTPKATEAVYGITRLSTAAVSAVAPIAVGDNDTRVPTQGENNALVGNNTDIAVGTGNKFVTQTGLQHNAECYAADAGANDTYVITLSPVPTSLTAGMVVNFKANTANTRTCTLNVNGLGAKTIVKNLNSNLSTGDILAGQLVSVIYDGTNFQVISFLSGDLTNKKPYFCGETMDSKKPVCIYPCQSDGGIKIDTSGHFASNSQAVTVANNSNRGLLVFVAAIGSYAATVNGVTYGGDAMTLVCTQDYSDGGGTIYYYTFYINAPKTGANNLVTSVSAGTANVTYYSLYNVKQSTQPKQNVHNGNLSNTLTTTANGSIVFANTYNSSARTGTATYENVITQNHISSDSSPVYPSGTVVTLAITVGSNTPVSTLIEIEPYATPVTGLMLTSSAAATNQYVNKYDTFIGFTEEAGNYGDTVAVSIQGEVSGLSSLSDTPKKYYLADTVGTIGISAGTVTRKIGINTSPTTLDITNIW